MLLREDYLMVCMLSFYEPQGAAQMNLLQDERKTILRSSKPLLLIEKQPPLLV